MGRRHLTEGAHFWSQAGLALETSHFKHVLVDSRGVSCSCFRARCEHVRVHNISRRKGNSSEINTNIAPKEKMNRTEEQIDLDTSHYIRSH